MSQGQEMGIAMWIIMAFVVPIAFLPLVLHFRYFKVADKVKEVFGVKGVLEEDMSLFEGFDFYVYTHFFCYRFKGWKIGCIQYRYYTGIEYPRYLFYIQKEGYDFAEGLYSKALAANLGVDKVKARYLSDLHLSNFFNVTGFRGAACCQGTTTYFFEVPLIGAKKVFRSVKFVMEQEPTLPPESKLLVAK